MNFYTFKKVSGIEDGVYEGLSYQESIFQKTDAEDLIFEMFGWKLQRNMNVYFAV